MHNRIKIFLDTLKNCPVFNPIKLLEKPFFFSPQEFQFVETAMDLSDTFTEDQEIPNNERQWAQNLLTAAKAILLYIKNYQLHSLNDANKPFLEPMLFESEAINLRPMLSDKGFYPYASYFLATIFMLKGTVLKAEDPSKLNIADEAYKKANKYWPRTPKECLELGIYLIGNCSLEDFNPTQRTAFQIQKAIDIFSDVLEREEWKELHPQTQILLVDAQQRLIIQTIESLNENLEKCRQYYTQQQSHHQQKEKDKADPAFERLCELEHSDDKRLYVAQGLYLLHKKAQNQNQPPPFTLPAAEGFKPSLTPIKIN